ncbi:hypothetical protein IXO159_10115 [Xanthomonas oryzae pv. oryzae]|nr:hypothetical protein IXO90_03415 [Xanthomonas oryzae pv. oryzae]OLI32599.1 hypothetical protein IXO93_02310 [Xanthomonas oryzae pv. oryzae]OLI65646.1 hypothetical protein IXO159_10115 [Xanthomonas oryzae pv. oryzae]OLK23123.1 hypothetical protein IXO621_07730 [Xanthomonas oryzae pv. oryzae]OLK28425.1 hypothetical protein IXO603_08240 [Xanthomonas oryzae pv. oryzae]
MRCSASRAEAQHACWESGEQGLSITTSTSQQVPGCSHMNMAIINEQITLQCSIAVLREFVQTRIAMSNSSSGITSSYNAASAVAGMTVARYL